MRLIGIDSITEGMILGRAIYNMGVGVLLSAGVTLSTRMIERIQSIGISSLYIEDEFSQDIEVNDAITPELRYQFADKMKGFFTANDMSRQQMTEFKKETSLLISSVISQVQSNKDAMVSLTDLKTYDDYTFQHSVNVGVLCAVTGAEMSYTAGELKDLVTAGIFHDIGKK